MAKRGDRLSNNNRNTFLATVKRKGFPIVPIKPEASYLLWIDCRKCGLKYEKLHGVFLEKAGISLNSGSEFGEAGKGFVRLNFATTRANLLTALRRMEQIFK